MWQRQHASDVALTVVFLPTKTQTAVALNAGGKLTLKPEFSLELDLDVSNTFSHIDNGCQQYSALH